MKKDAKMEDMKSRGVRQREEVKEELTMCTQKLLLRCILNKTHFIKNCTI